MRFLSILTIALSLLSGCGSGDSVPQPMKISVYGDSISAASPDLNPGFSAELSQLLGLAVTDHARGGGSVRDFSVVDDTDLVLIRYSGADALHYGSLDATQVAIFKSSLVSLIKSAKKKVVLTGTIRLAPYEQLLDYNYPHDAYLQKVIDLDVYDNAVREVSKEMNIPFIDIRLVPFYGREDLRDEVHPNQKYSTRFSNYIAKELIQYLQ